MKKVFLACKIVVLCCIIIAICYTGVKAQSTKNDKAAAIKAMVDSMRYVFKAQSAIPTVGGLRQLTPEYDMKVLRDTIISYLPYFGRGYSAPIDPSGDAGIKFTSTRFTYTKTDRKKGGWDIVIKPADAKDIMQLYLTIFDNGYAVLQVSSNSRQPISFNGYIEGRK